MRSLATLAYDCRRSDFFTGHLLDALRIVERGDLTPAQMRGGWAGEIGHTQFLPSGYYKYAVDFDGDGRRDLEHSVPDMLASTANFLKGHGWQAGQGWEPGIGQLRRAQGLEPRRGLPAHHCRDGLTPRRQLLTSCGIASR